MSDAHAAAGALAARALLWIVLAGAGAMLATAVLSLPEDGLGLADETLADLGRTGVEHPVTAVLMNYRAYDTLLEMAVLFLALVGVWSMAEARPRPTAPPGLVLQFLTQLLVPFLILFAGYLLWAGAHEPGGAFQAGAVLAAAGVLVTLSGAQLPSVPRALHRSLLLLGLVTFAAAGVAVQLGGGAFLEFPPSAAKALILAIEAAAGISIGLGLVAIFEGGRPSEPESAPR
ncbi:MAG: sodium:proton antiporter [Gammaproteobacteria bacterium]|nr:sodium:proton antiporter [Gammaproteobacteria bacterium]